MNPLENSLKKIKNDQIRPQKAGSTGIKQLENHCNLNRKKLFSAKNREYRKRKEMERVRDGFELLHMQKLFKTTFLYRQVRLIERV